MVGCGPAVVGCPQWVAVGKMREEGDEERRSQDALTPELCMR